MLKTTKLADIKRKWHVVDAKGQTLGRLATGIATKLVGKNKTYFVRNLDCGDYVVVVNCADIKITGNKANTKVYTRYSGYPGGLKSITLKKKMSENPTEVLRLAVKGMLPNNKLRDVWITRLFPYATEVHPYSDKFVKKENVENK